MPTQEQLNEIASQFDVMADIRPVDTAVDRDGFRERDYKGDESLFVRFRYVPIYAKFTGRHKNILHTEIHHPGLARDITCRPTTEQDKIRFSRQWAAFERKEDSINEGTPLTELPFMSAAMEADLNGLKVYTLEQLCAIPDSALGMLGQGGRTIRAKAEAYLDKQSGGTIVDKVIDENRNLQMQIAQKDEAMQEVLRRLKALESGEVLKEKIKDVEEARQSKPAPRKASDGK